MKAPSIGKVGLGIAIALATITLPATLHAQPHRSTTPRPSVHTLSQAAPQGAAFVGDAHPTSGSAQIIEEQGQRYLQLDAAFRTDAGPDLLVLLHTQAVPTRYNGSNYISLGQVQRVAGAQRYAIPADADLQAIQSAVIWCRQFNVTFGYATL